MQVKELGAGSFGTCKLAIDHDGEYVAVKFIPRGRKVRVLLVLSHLGCDGILYICSLAAVAMNAHPSELLPCTYCAPILHA